MPNPLKPMESLTTEQTNWIKATLADLKLALAETPDATLWALRRTALRLVPNGDERKTEIPDAPEDEPKPPPPLPKWLPKWKGKPRHPAKPAPEVKNPEADPTEKQLATVKSLHEQLADFKMVSDRGNIQDAILGFGEKFDNIDGYDVLNRGEISKLIGAYLALVNAVKAQRRKAGQ